MTEHVRVYDITVRGKKRRIYDPDHVLRAFQKRIKEKMFDLAPVSDAVHGFVEKRGCRTNAEAHLKHLMNIEGDGKMALLRVDIQNFFPSIKVDRVHGIVSKVFGLQPKPAWLVTRLCTHDGHLAQGLPNSPIISNMIAWRIDRRLEALAASLNMAYTRYADDMYMSGLIKASGDWLMEKIQSIITEEGFIVNKKKSAILRNRIMATGVVIDVDAGITKLPSRKRKQIRAMVDHWPEQSPERRARIIGVISWALDVHRSVGLEMKARIDEFEAGGGKKTWVKSLGEKGNIRRELHKR